ncbi:KxYKxGKxW signal peptide domain-containing protein, partial [Lactococcus sp. DD01]|uniref:KxYKxGKxW signal peptide domain-containing protein n=1 Tax=Lactococcus sp. DD01 TaxID=1776443 RepID=UPI000B07E2EB
MKNKKKGLIKQVTRFKMHKSGKFWVVSSLTQFSWLNLSKKTARQVKAEVKAEVDNDAYQRLYEEDDSDPDHLGQGLKILTGLAAGLGVGIVGDGLVGNHASAEEVGIEKQQSTDVLAQKDSVAITLGASESVSESTASSLSESESVSDSLALQSETDLRASVVPFAKLEGFEQIETGAYTYNLGAWFNDNLLGHATRDIHGEINTRSGNFNGKAWNDALAAENGLTDDFKITLKTNNGEYVKWEEKIGPLDVGHVGVKINFSFVDELYAPGAGETFDITFHMNGANHTFTLPNNAYDASVSSSESESLSGSESTSVSESTSDSEYPSLSISESESLSSSESGASLSESDSISASESLSNSESESSSISESLSVSESESTSDSEYPSLSTSESESLSNSESDSESTSESVSVSDSESTSSSESTSDSSSISESESL